MGIKLDYSNTLAENIGKEHGLSIERLEKALKEFQWVRDEVQQDRKSGKIRFMELPGDKKLVNEINAFAEEVRGKFDNFVVLGIGGSALGNIALQTALRHPYHNLLAKDMREDAPKMFFLDNVDPEQTAGLFDEILNPKKTLFNVISKSGGTAETMASYMIALNELKDALGEKYTTNVIATTDNKSGILRGIADKEHLRTFPVPDGVGGRFTILSAVGLLSAAVSGIDIVDLMKGANSMVDRVTNSKPENDPAYVNAVLHYLFDVEKNKRLSVMMPYSYALKDLADWYRQIWAESLGKAVHLDGSPAFCGPTPIKALGATDQHSQVQLYVEGPFDKVVTFLGVEKFRQDYTIPGEYPDIDDLAYLGDQKMSALINAERLATAIALKNAKRPNLTVLFPEISPNTVGEFLMMYEVQVAYAGKMYRINAFDQPGVEAGKIATFALMGRKGYEKQRAEIEQQDKNTLKRII